MKVKAHSMEHRKLILKWLLSKGYEWHRDIIPHSKEKYFNADSIEKSWSYNDYPYIEIRKKDKYLCGFPDNNSCNYDDVISLPELEKYING